MNTVCIVNVLFKKNCSYKRADFISGYSPVIAHTDWDQEKIGHKGLISMDLTSELHFNVIPLLKSIFVQQNIHNFVKNTKEPIQEISVFNTVVFAIFNSLSI